MYCSRDRAECTRCEDKPLDPWSVRWLVAVLGSSSRAEQLFHASRLPPQASKCPSIIERRGDRVVCLPFFEFARLNTKWSRARVIPTKKRHSSSHNSDASSLGTIPGGSLIHS